MQGTLALMILKDAGDQGIPTRLRLFDLGVTATTRPVLVVSVETAIRIARHRNGCAAHHGDPSEPFEIPIKASFLRTLLFRCKRRHIPESRGSKTRGPSIRSDGRSFNRPGPRGWVSAVEIEPV